jgi:asparagine synthase (glutamine-hydrolysing)
MCGICGELRFDGRAPREVDVVAMRDRIFHRGPDSDGVYISPSGGAGLGFRRLRIIDLSRNASQPMSNEDGSVWLVFNGEVYNYQDLRKGLVARGHQFRSQSDSETIIHLYEEKGASAIDELDGMFGLALWDERNRRLTLARDRAGKKPLFRYRSDRLFAFASEIKAFFGHPDIAIDVNHDAVPSYLIHGYVPGPETLYKHVEQIEPGTVLTIEADGRERSRRYWHIQFPDAGAVSPIERRDAAARVRDAVMRAVERRLMSDVPLGAFLSGGVDSTIVVGVMSQLMSTPVKTFSIGFEGDANYDETSYARIAVERFKTDHTEFRVSPSAVDLIDTLIWHHDGPFGDSSAVPTYIVSKLAREHVTVVLTGDGGDEVFAGYRRFAAALMSERLPSPAIHAARVLSSALPAPRQDRTWWASAHRFVQAAADPVDLRVTRWMASFFDNLDVLLRPDFRASLRPIDKLAYLAHEQERMRGLSTLSRLLHANFSSYLPDDLLVKADRCTMANSLEARSPFLDRELIELVARLPDDFKLRGQHTKVILREAFADLLPPEINRRGKMGFGVPVGAWFRGQLRDYLRDRLLAPDARYREMLSGPFVERLVHEHVSGKRQAGPQLWTLICSEEWLRLLPTWTRASSAEQPALVH